MALPSPPQPPEGFPASYLLPNAVSQIATAQLGLAYDVVRDFNASGSSQSTTGSISAGSTTLTLTSAIDFQNGQGISIANAGPLPTISAPSAPTVTATGTTGTTTWAYAVAALDGKGGETAASPVTTITNGNATLSSTNYNAISWTAVSGAAGYAVYRTTAGGTPNTTGLIATVSGTSFNDTGVATITPPVGVSSTPPASALGELFVTTIQGGAGTTTLTLAAAASTTVAGVTVQHDDTAAWQQALAQGGTIWVPVGFYNLSQTLSLSKQTRIIGEANLNGGGVTLHLLLNTPGIASNGQTLYLEHLTILGSKVPAYTAQEGVVINANNCYLYDVFFDNCYNSLHITDSAFFCLFDNLTFYDAVNYHVLGDGTTQSGYAFQMANSQVTTPGGSTLADVFHFTNFGSVELVNVMMSPTNASGFSVVFDQPAPLAGVQLLVGCQFEGGQSGALHLIGSASTPVAYVLVSDSYLAGGQNSSTPHTAPVTIEYARECAWSNCYLTGNVAGVMINQQATNLVFQGCQWQINNVCIAASNNNNATVNGLYCYTPIYPGGYPFVYLNNLPAANVTNLEIRGGVIGSNSTPVALAGVPATARVDVIGFNKGALTAPTVPASGTALTNPFFTPCAVTVTGGTVSAIAVNGQTTGITSGTVVVPAGGTITLTYSAAPSWVWIGL